ncbi:MAG: hypothetical protein ACRD2L_24370 [Terriglobia bacterium]
MLDKMPIHEALYRIADIFKANPNMKGPNTITISHFFSKDPRSAAREVTKALGTFEKAISPGAFRIHKKVGPIELEFYFWRKDVCVKRVVGTETVKVKKAVVPAHVETIEVEETREVVVWDCPSLLLEDDAPVQDDNLPGS